MAHIHGSRIVTDGLAMYMDAANIKSFRGEPTTNLVDTNLGNWGVSDWGGGSGHTVLSGLNELDNNYKGIQPAETSSTNLIIMSPAMTLSSPAGKTYTASFDYWASGTLSISLYSSDASYYEYGTIYTIETFDFGWKRAYASWTIPSNYTGSNIFYIIPRGGKITIKISRPQFEAKNHATPFVVGTRGTTVATGGGFGDLTSNHHGTIANSPLYSSSNNGCLLFDGGYNYITFGTGNDFFPMPEFTLDVWSKSSGLGSGMTAGGVISITYGIGFGYRSGGNFLFYLDDGLTFNSLYTTGLNLFDGVWHNIVATTTGAKSQIFVDGVYNNQLDCVWLGYSRWPTNTCYIGTDANNPPIYYLAGNISSIKIYSRVLSNDEILLNYKSLKGRFGL